MMLENQGRLLSHCSSGPVTIGHSLEECKKDIILLPESTEVQMRRQGEYTTLS